MHPDFLLDPNSSKHPDIPSDLDRPSARTSLRHNRPVFLGGSKAVRPTAAASGPPCHTKVSRSTTAPTTTEISRSTHQLSTNYCSHENLHKPPHYHSDFLFDCRSYCPINLPPKPLIPMLIRLPITHNHDPNRSCSTHRHHPQRPRFTLHLHAR
jgi:hypothetical protein